MPAILVVGLMVWLGLAATASASTSITPVAGSPSGGTPGFQVEFRKAPCCWETANNDSLAQAAALFALSESNSNVIADATDNGVRTINYLDSGGGINFPSPRDVGNSTLTMIKQTSTCCGVNYGTFNPYSEDDQFAMQASGYVYIPSAGPWTFVIKSDDAMRLELGTKNAIVSEFNGGRSPQYGDNQGGTIDSVANVPCSGFYPLNVLYDQGGGGAMVELTAVKGSYPEPTNGAGGFLPSGAKLVGDTAAGGLQVYENVAGGSSSGTGCPAPTLTTTASVAQGHVLSDAATVQGGSDPGGELVYELFGPSDPNCQSDAMASSTVPVHGDGDYSSDPFTVQTPGTYNYMVFYEPGSSNNQSTRTGCGGGSESVTVYPPPSVTITTPANGAFYALGQVVSASFACTDGAGAPGIASCVGPVSDAARIDTSVVGPRAFTVVATSKDGWTAAGASAYTVVGTPFVVFSARRQLRVGARAFVHYSCRDGAGAPGIRSCTGSVRSGSRLNTRRAGRHRVTVTVISRDGFSRTYTFTYRVIKRRRKHHVRRKHRARASVAAFDPFSIW